MHYVLLIMVIYNTCIIWHSFHIKFTNACVNIWFMLQKWWLLLKTATNVTLNFLTVISCGWRLLICWFHLVLHENYQHHGWKYTEYVGNFLQLHIIWSFWTISTSFTLPSMPICWSPTMVHHTHKEQMFVVDDTPEYEVKATIEFTSSNQPSPCLMVIWVTHTHTPPSGLSQLLPL